VVCVTYRTFIMVSTRTTRDARTTKPSTAAKDLELNTETKLPRKIPNTGPSTASAVAPANARNTRSSSRKKPAANAGRTGSAQIVNRVGKDTPSDEPTEPVRLEDKFELAAMDEVSTKKRTNVEVIEFDEDEPAPQQRRVTRARGRASTDATPTETAVVNLTCDERLVAERGFALASVEEVGAAEDVYPFSTKGGRRSNERKHALTPYVENGDLFSAAMRQDLVDWMSCQHASLDLADETFHLALRYLDTFLLRRGTCLRRAEASFTHARRFRATRSSKNKVTFIFEKVKRRERRRASFSWRCFLFRFT
jgi:hypothetical protein